MTAIAPLGGPILQETRGCKIGSNNDASFHEGDSTPVIESSPVGPFPASVTAPCAARRKSSFRVKPDQSQHPIDQNAESSKKVHFRDRPEQTRVFSLADAPLSLKFKRCSDTGAAVKAELMGYNSNTFQLNHDKRMCTLNSTSRPPSLWQPVRLQNLELLPSGCKIKGTVAVLNLAFQKGVCIPFTFDDWKTVSDVAAEHCQSLFLSHTIHSDLFTFIIDAERPPLDTDGRLQICACYQVLDAN